VVLHQLLQGARVVALMAVTEVVTVVAVEGL
jgi:hypothetical protein